MCLVFDGKQFDDMEAALCELAFAHYPLSIVLDGKTLRFEEFSQLEKTVLGQTDNQ